MGIRVEFDRRRNLDNIGDWPGEHWCGTLETKRKREVNVSLIDNIVKDGLNGFVVAVCKTER